MMPAEVFDTPTQRKILRVLAEKNRQYTINELAEMCHRSNSTISRALSGVQRYPFFAIDRVEGSKQKLYGLDTESEYAGPIRQFFAIERERERRGGTIPADVWNLLEDVTGELAAGMDEFVDLFLFGSYATGEYYSASDVDLVLVVDGDRTAAQVRANDIIDRLDPSRDIQLLVAGVDLERGTVPTADTIRGAARERAPVSTGEPMIALWSDIR